MVDVVLQEARPRPVAPAGGPGAAARKAARKSPSVCVMMFAFVMQETRLRPLARAYSNAKRMIRSEPSGLGGLIEIPELSGIRFGWRAFKKSITACASSVPDSNSIPA